MTRSYMLIKSFTNRGMLHDETIYPDPDVFKPERWLGKPRDPNTHVLDVVFGFGRRYVPVVISLTSLGPNHASVASALGRFLARKRCSLLCHVF